MRKSKKEVTATRAVIQLVVYITAKVALMMLVRKALQRALDQRMRSGELSPETLRALEAIGRSKQEGPKVEPVFDHEAMSTFDAFVHPKEA